MVIDLDSALSPVAAGLVSGIWANGRVVTNGNVQLIIEMVKVKADVSQVCEMTLGSTV